MFYDKKWVTAKWENQSQAAYSSSDQEIGMELANHCLCISEDSIQ